MIPTFGLSSLTVHDTNFDTGDDEEYDRRVLCCCRRLALLPAAAFTVRRPCCRIIVVIVLLLLLPVAVATRDFKQQCFMIVMVCEEMIEKKTRDSLDYFDL
jgi:hypothetical protein